MWIPTYYRKLGTSIAGQLSFLQEATQAEPDSLTILQRICYDDFAKWQRIGRNTPVPKNLLPYKEIVTYGNV